LSVNAVDDCADTRTEALTHAAVPSRSEATTTGAFAPRYPFVKVTVTVPEDGLTAPIVRPITPAKSLDPASRLAVPGGVFDPGGNTSGTHVELGLSSGAPVFVIVLREVMTGACSNLFPADRS